MTTDESRIAGGSDGEGPEPGERAPDAGPREGTSADELSEEEIPLGQRIYDSPFLLLVAGIVIMLVFYTGWGLWEIVTLPEAPLP